MNAEPLLLWNGTTSTYIPWSKSGYDNERFFSSGRSTALGGDEGFIYECRNDYPLSMEARGPFYKSTWLRFAIRIDDWQFRDIPAESTFVKDFLNISFSEPVKGEQPAYFIRSMIFSAGKRLYVNYRLKYQNSPLKYRDITYPIGLGKNNLLELNFRDEGVDTLSVTAYLNGVVQTSIKDKFSYSRNFTAINLFSYKRKKLKPIKFKIDDFALSDRRLDMPPSYPDSVFTIVDSLQVILNAVSSQKEPHKATRWFLYNSDDSLHPIYVTEEVDPNLLYSRTIPFALGKGKYLWSAYYVNKDLIPGPASVWGKFEITDSRISKRIMIAEASVSAGELNAGSWYEFSIKTEQPLHKNYPTYFIVSLNNPAYIFGHPGNKGGAYICSLNTVYNISLNGDSTIRFYEKFQNGSLKSLELQPGVLGVT
ncbi:MAG: hypothetical protein JNL74_23660, partial [Fibrobacteres bacterium]|nr:hypothetical protein [Fibrobacterota bacterium]